MGANESVPQHFVGETFIVTQDSMSPFLVDVARIDGLMDSDAFSPVIGDDSKLRVVIRATPGKIRKLIDKLQEEQVITQAYPLWEGRIPLVDYSPLVARTVARKKTQSEKARDQQEMEQRIINAKLADREKSKQSGRYEFLRALARQYPGVKTVTFLDPQRVESTNNENRKDNFQMNSNSNELTIPVNRTMRYELGLPDRMVVIDIDLSYYRD